MTRKWASNYRRTLAPFGSGTGLGSKFEPGNARLLLRSDDATEGGRSVRLIVLQVLCFAGLLSAVLIPSALAAEPKNNPTPGEVVVFDTATKQLVGKPIAVGKTAGDIVSAPDGHAVYVLAATPGQSVVTIDPGSNQVVGSPMPIGRSPQHMSVTSDGRFIYVANNGPDGVYVIDTQTQQFATSPFTLGYVEIGPSSSQQASPSDIAVTPDGKTAYAVFGLSSSEPLPGRVAVIDTQTFQVSSSMITVGTSPTAVAITPDGRFAYVVNALSNNVSVIDTQTNQVVGPPIPVGAFPTSLAITPDGRFAYVVSRTDPGGAAQGSVSVIDTQTNQVVGPLIQVGPVPHAITITPNGKVYISLFRQKLAPPNPTRLGVRVRCPAQAKPGGCRFKLRAVTKRRKGKARSALSKAKVGAGHSALVRLKPRHKFRAGFLKAKKALIKETVTIKGSTKTRFRWRKLVARP
jgi:YVTN family beta-propeller protein